MKKLAVTLALLAASALTAAHAQSLSYTTIDNPADPTFNQLLGINDAGTIAGYFGSGAQVGHPNKGYSTTVAHPTRFTALNVPGSVQTQDTGINAAGLITGFWSDTNLGAGDNNFGFVSMPSGKNRTYILVNDPFSAGAPLITQVLGINKNNTAVGFYNDAMAISHGFLYLVGSAAYQPFQVPGSVSAAATGINDNEIVCGFFVNKKNQTLGFTRPSHSTTGFKTFAVPGALQTQLLGIDNAGLAVGFYEDTNMVDHGILYNSTNGTYVQVDDPNGTGGTVLNGINNMGQAVGFYTDGAGNVHGLLVGGV